MLVGFSRRPGRWMRWKMVCHGTFTIVTLTGTTRDGRTEPVNAYAHLSPGSFLSRARTEIGHAEYLCRTPPLRLIIRVRSGHHHLAGWPGEGHEHAAPCPFHKIHPTVSGRAQSSKPTAATRASQ
ncbi:DUF1173 family protein [Streptomyces radicis]|uniref:DUF1173 family protein n=2 Tax=Streptomyces radicis TaxID=1750517 RepID=A0A3A9WE03_9ACTN|nr:DUF1173 family protein [Streptomyces radicis]RKN25272.1 DUF1173 family protein [Streptomyces radicis]